MAYGNFRVCPKCSLFLFTMGLRNRKFGFPQTEEFYCKNYFILNESQSMKKERPFFYQRHSRWYFSYNF